MSVPGEPAGSDRLVAVSAEQLSRLFEQVSNWGRWGDEDQLGTMNELTPERVAAAARLIRSGETVTLALPLATEPGGDHPEPADHHMTLLDGAAIDSETLRFAKDYIGVDYHNDGHSHIDALCHVAYGGRLYNGRPSASITEAGGTDGTIELLKDGIVGRGVLLDVPALRGLPWLEPGEHIFAEDIERAEAEQGTSFGAGDILLIRTGLPKRLAELGPWDTTSAKAGLHPTAIPLLADRGIAALGSDGNSDTAPSSTEGNDFPIHTLTLNAMGMPLLDYLQFEDLAGACRKHGRWDFLFTAAPLRIDGGTGSPLNPLAVL